MISRFLYGPCYRAVTNTVVAFDRWMHFHRFEARFVCDLADRCNGIPWVLITKHRRGGAHAHSVADQFSSYLRHPSHDVEVES